MLQPLTKESVNEREGETINESGVSQDAHYSADLARPSSAEREGYLGGVEVMKKNDTNVTNCETVRIRLQDYLDHTLPRKESMALFLHVRECDGCREELEAMERLFGFLGDFQPVEAPANFDARILESVPYAAYQAMEPLRRERMPVILEEEALPAFVRAKGVRASGGVVAVLAAVGLATGNLPEGWAALAVAGVLPEVLVRLQNASRRIYAGVIQRSSAR